MNDDAEDTPRSEVILRIASMRGASQSEDATAAPTCNLGRPLDVNFLKRLWLLTWPDATYPPRSVRDEERRQALEEHDITDMS